MKSGMRPVELEHIKQIVDELARISHTSKVEQTDLEKIGHTTVNYQLVDSIRKREYAGCEDGILSASLAVLSGAEGSPLKYAEGYIAPLANNERVDVDTLYNVGSISKTILMMMSLRLMQSGHLKFTDTIEDHLKDTGLPNADAITIEHLLGHHSGYIDCAYIPFSRSEPLTHLLKYKKDGSPDLFGKPGENFFYSNINYVIIAHIIEKIMDLSLDVAFSQLIADPLKLDNICLIDSGKKPFASGYKAKQTEDALVPSSHEFIFGATGFRASPADLVKLFSNFFMNPEFISTENKEKILASAKNIIFTFITGEHHHTWPAIMGMGIEVRNVEIEKGRTVKLYIHGGWQDGHAACIAFCEENNMAYSVCATKTQSIRRLVHAKMPKVLFGMGLFSFGLLALSKGSSQLLSHFRKS